MVMWQWLLYSQESSKNGMARGLFNYLLCRNHPQLIRNNGEMQVTKPPNQLAHLWAAEDLNAGAVEELCSMIVPVWSHWMFYSPNVIIVTFSKHCTWFYSCSFPLHQHKFTRQYTKSDSANGLVQKLPIALFPNLWQLLLWSLVSTCICLPDEAVTAFCSSCEMEW